ncbi:MAG: hypothetical protein ACRC6I_13960 [Paracoccaceae bacterium]
MILHGQSEIVARFVADLLGFGRGFGECQAIGFLDAGGNLVAGIVYHQYQPEQGIIEISAASTCRSWLTRANLSEIFDYPFRIGCRMVVARIGEHNQRARRIWRSLGADEYVIPALRSPQEAECIFTLSAEQWRNGKFGSKDHRQAEGTEAA